MSETTTIILDSVAVHVDGLQDAFRQVFVPRRGQLGDKEVQDDGKPFPIAVGVGQDRGEEIVGADERLRFAFEIHLSERYGSS